MERIAAPRLSKVFPSESTLASRTSVSEVLPFAIWSIRAFRALFVCATSWAFWFICCSAAATFAVRSDFAFSTRAVTRFSVSDRLVFTLLSVLERLSLIRPSVSDTFLLIRFSVSESSERISSAVWVRCSSASAICSLCRLNRLQYFSSLRAVPFGTGRLEIKLLPLSASSTICSSSYSFRMSHSPACLGTIRRPVYFAILPLSVSLTLTHHPRHIPRPDVLLHRL